MQPKKIVNQNNYLQYRKLLEEPREASKSWYSRPHARQLAWQLQGHAGLFAALGLVQACVVQQVLE